MSCNLEFIRKEDIMTDHDGTIETLYMMLQTLLDEIEEITSEGTNIEKVCRQDVQDVSDIRERIYALRS